MKKLLAIPLLAVLGLGACAAGGEGEEATGTPEILLWTDSVREPAALQYAESVEGEVDVTIEVVDAFDLQSRIQLFNTTGSGWPDLVFAQPNDVAAWADPSNAYALNLDEYVDPAIFAGYNGSNDWCLIDDSFYCLKNDLAQTVLWYDTVLFEELGLTVPTTMEEFAATALQLEGTDYVAGAIGDQNYYASYLWPAQCPVSQVTAPNEVRIDPDSANCTKVHELVQPLVDAGVLDTRSSFDAGFISEVAQAGNVVMTLGPSWFGEFVIRPESSWAVPEDRIAAAPMPIWDGATEAYSGEWGGGIWVASSHAAFPQAAADAVVFLATDPGVAETAVTFPGYEPAYEAWSARISADTYYAEDIVPALVTQAGRISPLESPVRFNNVGPIGSVLQAEINAGSPVAEATRLFQENLIELAPGSGYTVIQ